MKQNEELLRNVLDSFGIPTHEWGTGKAKTVRDLLIELEAGECQLIWGQGIKRFVKAVGLIITCPEHLGCDRPFYLKEEKQVFVDGRERQRDLDTSVGEKILPGESHWDAADRALKEELGISRDYSVKVLYSNPWFKDEESESYPDLKTEYKIDVFTVQLPLDLIPEEGCVIQEHNKTVYYVWTREPPKFA